MKRLIWLDGVRGLAALGILLWHWQHFGRVDSIHDFDITEQPLFGLLFPFYRYAWLGVDLFFLISGYIFFLLYSEKITKGKISLTEFIWKRFARIYPLLFLTTILVFCLQNIYLAKFGSSFVFSRNSLEYLPIHLIVSNVWFENSMNGLNQPSWSISVEAALYLVFYLILRKFRVGLFTCSLIVVFGYLVIYRMSGYLGRGVGAFFLGGGISILVKNYKNTKILMMTELLSYSVFIVFVGGLAFMSISNCSGLFSADDYLKSTPRFVVYFVSIAIVFPAIVVTAVSIPNSGTRVDRIVSWLGDVSYGVYLWHFPVQVGLVLWLSELEVYSSLIRSSLGLLLFVFLCLLIATAGYKYAETPAKNWLASIKIWK